VIVVIGVGNEFRRDDGAGPQVIDRLGQPPPRVRLAVCDGEPARLIGLWEDADLAIAVDAVRGDRPGRVHELDLDTVSEHRGGASSHALGLGSAVELAHALDRLPRRLVILAVEAADFGLGPGLSPAVEAALPELIGRVEQLVRSAASAPESRS
jgi:hydrogenase maturation protease